MKAHQRKIREAQAQLPEPNEAEKRSLASSLNNATVREIDHKTASSIILKYEWLGNMGTTEYAFGLYFGEYLAGVVCFGRTAGSNVKASICGKEFADKAITLCRGACVHWADSTHTAPDGKIHTGGAASFLINRACDLMVEKGYNIFIAYSDVDAGEIGTVYQAANWLYCGKGGSPTLFVHPDGRTYDSRKIGTMTRSRKGRPPKGPEREKWIAQKAAEGFRVHFGATPWYETMTREEAKKELLSLGFVEKKGTAKHRYVHFAGSRGVVRFLRKKLKLKTFPYPKRSEL